MSNLFKNSYFIKYLKNTSWIFLEQFVKLCAIFIVNIFIARYLGPEKYGVLSLSVSVVAIALTVSRLGMESVLIRELIGNTSKAAVYITTAFSLIFTAGIFCIFLLYLILKLINVDKDTFNYIIFLSLSLIPQAFLVFDYYFQSQVKAKYSSLAKSLALVISAVFKLYLISVKASLLALIAAILFESILIAIFLFYIYLKKQSTPFQIKFDKVVASKLLKCSFPMLLASLTTVLYMRVDQLMIKAMLGNFDLGVYSAVSRLYELWVMVSVVLCASLLPAIVRLKEQALSSYEHNMVLFFRVVVGASLFVAVLSSIFANELIQLLFGQLYMGGVLPFKILMWSSVFASIGSVTMRYLVVEKLERKVAQRTAVALGVNVVMNFILIPIVGLSGAAISTLISLLIANYIIDFFDKDLHQLLRLKNRAIFLTKMTSE